MEQIVRRNYISSGIGGVTPGGRAMPRECLCGLPLIDTLAGQMER